MTPLRRSIVHAALLVTGLAAGPLQAGDLEPPGPPGPTMKTLLQIPPTWSHGLDATNGEADGCNSSRFTCTSVGVLDNETGLLWQRNPALLLTVRWDTALALCASYPGVRGGWRLPSLPELTSLVQGLPFEAPFTFSGGRYWTMTTDSVNLLRAWTAGTNNVPTERRLKTQLHQVWCVRSAAPLNLY